MKNSQKGFTLIEITIGLIIFGIISAATYPLIVDYLFNKQLNRSARQFTAITTAVQARSTHDAFEFDKWDENGTNPPSGSDEISWSDTSTFSIDDLLDLYLIARKNNSCGDATDGWNPLNDDGSIDGGNELRMESTALVPCELFGNILPFNTTISAALMGDSINNSLSLFMLYINFDDVNFGRSNKPDNNFLNMKKFQQAIQEYSGKNLNGVTTAFFGTQGDDNDTITDDIEFTDTECETEVLAGNECDLIVEVNFEGFTNGRYKTTNKSNFMIDDLTFGTLAGGVQQCSKWTEDLVTGAFTAEIVDCGIQGGVGNDNVTLVSVDASSEGLRIVNRADVNHLCSVFERANSTGGAFNLNDTGRTTPCGFTEDGGVIQLLSDEAMIGTVNANELVSTSIYAEQTQLYRTGTNVNVLRVIDESGFQTFSLNNNGNLDSEGGASFAGTVVAESDIIASDNAAVLMNNNGVVRLGSLDNSGVQLVFNKDDAQNSFTVSAPNSDLELETSGELRVSAPDGVMIENGSTLHASISALTGDLFDATNGVDSDGLKALSEVVTYDFARMLDDTSSDVQIVGIDKIEGEFTQITKPDCLDFTHDTNYLTPDHNPYRGMVLPSGESLARLVMSPIYFKTFNESFGDNQIYAQHGVHSSPTTWDVFLYLSGEGAFGTGAREDAAGSSLAMLICDYSSIDFSRKRLD
jgi:prepilin-type N-terminal cleavage/methylation domain-containing protein